MHIQHSQKRVGDKVYTSVVVRESYREGDKVKKRSLLNISDWSSEKIAAFDALLKGKQLVVRDEVLLGGGKNIWSRIYLRELGEASSAV